MADKANMVSQFSEEQQEKIALTVVTDFDNDIDSRAEWEEKRNEWYKLWTCDRDDKNDPWPGASNVCIPMLATAANQFHARMYQALFAPPKIVKGVPVGRNDVGRAKNVEDFMNWQIMVDIDDYEDVFDKALLQLPIDGIAVRKLFWDKDGQKPQSEYISATDFVVPYRTKDLKSARRISHRLWLHYDEVQKRAEDGFYVNWSKIEVENDSDNPEENAPSPAKDKDPAIRETADDVVGESATMQSDAPRTIIEQHRDWTVAGKRTPMVFTVDKDTNTLVRATKRTYRDSGKDVELCHFVDYHFIPNPEGWYSFGYGHFLEQLNEMANTAFNQIFDSGRLTNQPFGFYGRRSGIQSRKIKLKPGLMQEVQDVTQIHFPSIQRVDQVLFQVLGFINRYVEQFTSVTELLTGRQQQGVKTPTATGTVAVIEQGLMTFTVMAKRIFRSFAKELELMTTLNNLNLPASKQYRIMETEDRFAFNTIKKEDFKGTHDVIPVGDPQYAAPSLRRQEASELYQILLQNPLVVGNPDAGIPPNQKAIAMATKDLLETYSKPDVDKYLPPIPAESFSPEIENSIFMQGDNVEPKTGEDHARHIQVHAEFAQGTMFAGMPKAYKDNLNNHVRETQAIAMAEMQMQQQMGGQPQQGVAQPQQGGGANGGQIPQQ